MKGTKSSKTTAIALRDFKCSCWINSCLLRNAFQERAQPPLSPFYHLTLTPTCPAMPRSTLQGRMAVSQQPDPMLDSHPVTQSCLFPSGDVFQPAPSRDLTLTCVQLGSHPTVQRGARHPAACNPRMNPTLPASLPDLPCACLCCWLFSTQAAISSFLS